MASPFGYFEIMLLHKHGCANPSVRHCLSSVGIYPEVGFLDRIAILGLTF